jgi:hypothetical protein
MHNKEWKKVQEHVGTRSSTQARSHAQKFFVKLNKKSIELERFRQGLDLANIKQSLVLMNISDSEDENDGEYVPSVEARRAIRKA